VRLDEVIIMSGVVFDSGRVGLRRFCMVLVVCVIFKHLQTFKEIA